MPDARIHHGDRAVNQHLLDAAADAESLNLGGRGGDVVLVDQVPAELDGLEGRRAVEGEAGRVVGVIDVIRPGAIEEIVVLDGIGVAIGPAGDFSLGVSFDQLLADGEKITGPVPIIRGVRHARVPENRLVVIDQARRGGILRERVKPAARLKRWSTAG